MNKGRLEAFSDGVFAIAITLLVLELHVPDTKGAGDAGLGAALLSLWPQYLVYVISFATIGIMWLNHHALFQNVREVSYALLVSNLLLLMGVSFLPYPTSVIGHYGPTPTTVLFYAGVMVVISLCYRALYYAGQPPGRVHGVIGYFTQWNLWNSVGLIGYIASIAIAWVSPIASIGIIAAVAVFYASPLSVRIALREPPVPE
jgi:uncharacterized membrane protein